jgi:hypothetical protein
MSLKEKYQDIFIVCNSNNEEKISQVEIKLEEYLGHSVAEIWLDLLNRDGEFLPSCCADISRIRAILVDVVLENKIIDVEKLYEIFSLLESHNEGTTYDDAEKHPLNLIKNLWLRIKDDVEFSDNNPVASSIDDVNAAINVLASGLQYLSYAKIFENHPYDDVKAHCQETLWKISPALKLLYENINNFNQETETYLITLDDKPVTSKTGYIFIKNEEKASETVRHLNEYYNKNYAYKKVKVSLEKGIEN